MILELENLIKRWNSFEKDREKLIEECAKTINLTKKHQLAVFRRDFDKAREILEEIKEHRKKYLKIAKRDDYFKAKLNIYNTAEQEFVETLLFHSFVGSNVIIPFSELNKEYKISLTTYFSGLLDFLGELKRIFIEYLAESKEKEAFELKENVLNIYKDLLNLNLKAGDLRKKFDGLRYLVKSMEEIHLNYKINKKG
jgi:predicted translin family RNA/ssDNA-binding protein